MHEPGIGILLVVCVAQCFIGNFIILMIEKKWKITSCFKGNKVSKDETDAVNVGVLEN